MSIVLCFCSYPPFRREAETAERGSAWRKSTCLGEVRFSFCGDFLWSVGVKSHVYFLDLNLGKEVADQRSTPTREGFLSTSPSVRGSQSRHRPARLETVLAQTLEVLRTPHSPPSLISARVKGETATRTRREPERTGERSGFGVSVADPTRVSRRGPPPLPLLQISTPHSLPLLFPPSLSDP